MLDQITPMLLTRNEAPNIVRTLSRLRWARDIVVVDSYSDDGTPTLIARFPQARVISRRFDTHAMQWNFALTGTEISTEWVLALDADYVLSDAILDEISTLTPSPDTNGYRASFTYVVQGRGLRGSTYPPVTVLFRRNAASYEQDGHTQRVVVHGGIGSLKGAILHDDRKSLRCWIDAQDAYMALEAEKLARLPWRKLGWRDRVRKLKVVAPFGIGFYCLFVKRTILDGWPGLYYTLQRVFAEILLSLRLIELERRLEQERRDVDQPTERTAPEAAKIP